MWSPLLVKVENPRQAAADWLFSTLRNESRLVRTLPKIFSILIFDLFFAAASSAVQPAHQLESTKSPLAHLGSMATANLKALTKRRKGGRSVSHARQYASPQLQGLSIAFTLLPPLTDSTKETGFGCVQIRVFLYYTRAYNAISACVMIINNNVCMTMYCTIYCSVSQFV